MCFVMDEVQSWNREGDTTRLLDNGLRTTARLCQLWSGARAFYAEAEGNQTPPFQLFSVDG
jgi:hypothetical protein